MANQPIKRIKVGSVTASIFENEVKIDGKDRKMHSINVQKAYTKDKGETWEHTNNFNINDLPKVALAVKQAYEFLTLKSDE